MDEKLRNCLSEILVDSTLQLTSFSWCNGVNDNRLNVTYKDSGGNYFDRDYYMDVIVRENEV